MARTVNQEDYARKRNEILDAVQRLITTRGYERMTMQDLQAELGMSSGALYHYFDSKPALLQGFIDRMREITDAAMLPLIRDPNLTALQKLQGFFDTLDRVGQARLEDAVRLGRVWYSDDNAVVRQNFDDSVAAHWSPLLAEVVRQGVAEGSFTTRYPDQAGGIIVSLLHGMNDTVARLLLVLADDPTNEANITAIVMTLTATMEALERALGAPPDSLRRADADEARAWITRAREIPPD